MHGSRSSSWHKLVLRLLLPLVLGPWASAAAQAGSLWFSDGQGLHRVDTATNVVVANASAKNVVAIATSARDASAWVLTTGELMKVDANGAKLIDLDFPHLPPHFDLVRRIAIDGDDDSIWVAGGNFGFHLSANAGLMGAFVLRSQVEDIALAGDGTLWVMGDEELATFSPQGRLLSHADLSQTMQQASFLALDEASSALWLGGSHKLFQISANLPVHTLHAITTQETIRAMALVPDSGTVWVAGSNTLAGYGKDGTSAGSTSLSQRHLANPQALAYDGSAQALWLGHDRGVSRFTAAGQFALTLPASVRVGALGAAAGSSIVPLVALVSPADNAVTNNPRIPIRLHYDASCSGAPCGYPSSVFAAYVLTATLNGVPIGSQFVFDPATNDAVYTPASPYADSVNHLTAFVTDGSARVSATLNAQFTVDAVPPRFSAFTPPDGTIVATPNVTLTGSIDDLQGHVLLESFSGATFTGGNPQGASFSYAITLQPGANAFRLTATDPAGNASVVSFTYTFSTLSITVTSPANGATIDADRVTVTGTFSGAPSATITVNGIAAVVSGTTFTATDVPLHFGANTLTVTGTTAQGATATRTLTVNSTAPAIIITTPAQGATVGGDRVLVSGHVQAAPRAGVQVNGVVASVDTAGNYFAVVPLAAGSNTLTAIATNPSGSSATASVAVSAGGQAPAMVASVDVTTGFAPLTVTYTLANQSAGDGSFTFDGAGPFAVPAGASVSLSVTYPQGVFTSTIVATDGTGATSVQPFVIEVTTMAAMDAMLQAMWHDITGRLAAGDIEGALTSFSPGQRDRYRQVLNSIAPSLPAMFASFPPITATQLLDTDAEYFVVVQRSGKNYGYYLYFTHDGDGVWRLNTL